MKRKGHLFQQVCTFGNLLAAFKRAFAASGKTDEACRFHFNLENELLRLKGMLEDDTYSPDRYRYFEISDPKRRTISEASFRDRIVHHAIIRVIEPVFDRAFIYDSYANRKGKGSHGAIHRAKSFLRKNVYYLKMDIRKYFESMDHAILMGLLGRRIKDKRLLALLGRIVLNSDASRGLDAGKGLPIGNLTSQFFANVYLDPFDHYLKETIRVQYYIRYMDDMVIFSRSKAYVREILKTVEEYLRSRLELLLNRDATTINSRLHGLSFLGFRIFPNLIRVRKENLKRMKTRLTLRKREFLNGLIPEERYVMSVRSMFTHLDFANSHMLRTSGIIKV